MNMVSIDYNPANSILFDKVQRETPVLLKRARNALNLSADGEITALDAFRIALPPTFIALLVQWLSQVLRDSNARFGVTGSDVWGFIMTQIILRATHQTFRRLESGRSNLHQKCAIFIQGYRRVRKAMGLDRPNREKDMADGTSSAAFSMSRHLYDVEEAARSHWVRMFFVPSVTWVDLDDDKLPFSSKAFEKFGVRLTPTKRRKGQPVVHVVASITTGFIVQTWVESLRRQLHSVIELAVRGLTCNPGEEAIGNVARSLTLFIDRGYLSIARNQEKDKETNIFQVLQRLGVKFVGTCRRTNSFPFADKDELKAPATQRDQVQVATGGRRTFYVIALLCLKNITMSRSGDEVRLQRAGNVSFAAGSVMTQGKTEQRHLRIRANQEQQPIGAASAMLHFAKGAMILYIGMKTRSSLIPPRLSLTLLPRPDQDAAAEIRTNGKVL